MLQATAQRVTAVEATSRLAISTLVTELREATVESSSSVATEPSSSSVAMVAYHSSAATAVPSNVAMVDNMAEATSSVATRADTSVATTEQAFI